MCNTIIHNLLRSSIKNPDKIAISHNGNEITYASLWLLICGCADFLLKNGLSESDRVVIKCNNSIEYVVTYYGVLKAGGIIVALNNEASISDVKHIIQHTNARFFFTNSINSNIVDLCLNEKIFHVAYEADCQKEQGIINWHDIFKEVVPNNTVIKTNSDSIAAIIYTSGTTGNPKGVTLTHSNIFNNVNSIIEYLNLTEDDSILNVLPFFYSYGNSVLHTHLSVGATIYLENSLMYPVKVIEKMEKNKITGFSGVPSTYALFLSRVKIENYDLSSLRYVTQAGGPMPPSNIKSFVSKLTHLRFYVMYGQTEATARISYLPPERLIEKLGSVGVPIPGVKVKICDTDGVEVNRNAEGEVYVSGENIMMGYWKNDEATSKTIINGWLRTGDLGYMDEDGYIYLSGRKSDIIKTGGHRVSPLEIEEIISQIDNIEDVAVTGVPDDILGEVIKAVVVLKDDNLTSINHIKAHCKNNLPIYKIPKIIEIVKDLPKTSSGKVKRYLL